MANEKDAKFGARSSNKESAAVKGALNCLFITWNYITCTFFLKSSVSKSGIQTCFESVMNFVLLV